MNKKNAMNHYMSKQRMVKNKIQNATVYKALRNPAAKKRLAKERDRDIQYNNVLKLSSYLITMRRKDFGNKTKASAHSISEHILRKLTHVHKRNLYKSYHAFYTCQKKFLQLLTNARGTTQVRFKLFKLTGNQKHLTTQMPYYCDEELEFNNIIPVDTTGDAITLPSFSEYPIMTSVGKQKCLAYEPSIGGQWECSYQTCGWGNNKYTSEVASSLETVYESFVKSNTAHIDEITKERNKCCVKTVCKMNGHDQRCYQTVDDKTFANVTGCNSFFLTLRRLQQHFPTLRTIVRLLYRMKQFHERSLFLKNILSSEPARWYKEYMTMVTAKEIEPYPCEANPSSAQFTDPNSTESTYRESVDIFNSHTLDLPVEKCFSCRQFKRRSKCIDVSKCNKLSIVNSSAYQELLRSDNIDIGKVKSDQHLVCHSCHAKLKKNEIPNVCHLNRMEFTEADEKNSSLHEWESMMIPRAHPFQAIYVPRTVAGARKPSSQSHRKAKGMTIHLPIPIEETLENVLKDDGSCQN